MEVAVPRALGDRPLRCDCHHGDFEFELTRDIREILAVLFMPTVISYVVPHLTACRSHFIACSNWRDQFSCKAVELTITTTLDGFQIDRLWSNALS